jgi:hypothetical protein
MYEPLDLGNQLTNVAPQVPCFRPFMEEYTLKIIEIERRSLDHLDDINVSLSLILCEIDDFARVMVNLLKVADLMLAPNDTVIKPTDEQTLDHANHIDILNAAIVHCGDPFSLRVLEGSSLLISGAWKPLLQHG